MTQNDVTILLSLLLLIAGGCSASGSHERTHAFAYPESGLVLPGSAMLELAEAQKHETADAEAANLHEDIWLASRNDAGLGSVLEPEAVVSVFEVRHVEYLRTINGRPREFSTTSVRSAKWGFGR